MSHPALIRGLLSTLFAPVAVLCLRAAPPAEPAANSTARVTTVAESAWAGSSVNVVANIRQALFTESRTQYAAFYDTDGTVVLAKRALGKDDWEVRRTDYKGNVADAHNSISLVVDGAGFLHVSWDHHGNPLNYSRGQAPGSLELGPREKMTGERESKVTYPQFFRLPDGDLLFLYRDGASGRGSLCLNRYSVAQRTWSVVQPTLIDGEGKRSPYWSMTVDSRGTLHLAWNWRDTPDVASNHDLCYARSSDGGRSWTRSDGVAFTMPITAATAEYAARIPTGSNLMNPPSIATSPSNQPFIVSYWSPAPGAAPRFHVVRHDGKAWQTIAGPERSGTFSLAGGGTKNPPISRAAVAAERNWRFLAVHLIYRDDSRGGKIFAATLADAEKGTLENAAKLQWNERELTSTSVGAWEPSLDPVSWARLGQIQMLVQQVVQRDGNDSMAAAVAGTPIGTLIWSPEASRRAAMHHTPAEKLAAPENLDRDPEPEGVRALLSRVADWQLSHPTRPHYSPRGWEIAPFLIGTLALDSISTDRRYRDAVVARAEANGWQPDRRRYHADDHCVTQAYLELHRQLGEPKMIAPTRARFDEILANPSKSVMDWNSPHGDDRWNWCDALFMGPVAWLQLWKATGDQRYLDFMNKEWWVTTERLYHPGAGFYFRDESYLDVREANGKTVHWARGNGWVFAGLCRVLDLFPKDHPDYPRYVRLYVEMADAVMNAQQEDGLWRVGILDPQGHPARETSGSSFMTFGLAWGINRGLIDRNRAEPAVIRAWNALSACVTPEGKLEHVQPVGAAPHGFDPHNSEPFAIGAFLLAGTELYRMVGGEP